MSMPSSTQSPRSKHPPSSRSPTRTAQSQAGHLAPSRSRSPLSSSTSSAASTPVSQSPSTSSGSLIDDSVHQDLERAGPPNDIAIDADIALALEGNAPPNEALREHLARLGILQPSPDGGLGQELAVVLPNSRIPKSYSACSAKDHVGWLAAVFDACASFGAPSDGQHDVTWVSCAQLLGNDGSRLTQEIDIALARRSGAKEATSAGAQKRGTKKVRASAVLVVMEAKLSDGFEEDWARQVARYARLVNEHSPARPVRIAVCFSKTHVVLFRFGCGAYSRRAFRRDSAPTPEMMLGLVRWCRGAYEAPLIAEDVEGGGLELIGGRRICWEGNPQLLFVKTSLFGSLTNVWRIKVIEGGTTKPKTLKLAWRPQTLATREEDVYQHLALRGPRSPVPPLSPGLSGIVSGAQDDADDRHALVAVVLDGEPLPSFEGGDLPSLLTLIRGIRDASRIIWWLEKHRVHHRDISTGNLRRQHEPDAGFDHGTLDGDWLEHPPRGDGASDDKIRPVLTSCLIDFGGARRMDDAAAGVAGFRSGTWEFIARVTFLDQLPKAVADDEGVPRQHRGWHDLESLANVFYWLIISHFVKDVACREERLKDWKYNNPGASHQLWAARDAFNSTFGKVRGHLALPEPHRDLVEMLLRGMRSMIDDARHRRRRELLLAEPSDAGKPASGGGGDGYILAPLPSRRVGLRADHEPFPDVDGWLFAQFIAASNAVVRALSLGVGGV